MGNASQSVAVRLREPSRTQPRTVLVRNIIQSPCSHYDAKRARGVVHLLFMMQVMRGSPVYDVVVIGSGAGGGTVAHVLTGLGVQVALLEAGPMLNPARDYKEHKTPADYAHRGAGQAAES